MYAIYGALPAELKRRIADLKIKHDGTYNSGGYLRQGVTPTDDPRNRRAPCIRWCAPIPNRPAHAVSRPAPQRLSDGLELAESEALLNELWASSMRPEFAWEHVWRVGDLVMWDNRCTMHRRDPFDATRGG